MVNKYITALLIAMMVAGGVYYYERPSIIGNNTLIYLGDSVYIEDSRVFINVTPHSLVGDGDVITELEIKNLTTVPPLTMLFGYNSEVVTPSNPRVYSPQPVTREESYVCNGVFNYTLNPKYFWCYDNNTVVFEHHFDRGSIPLKTAYWNVTEVVDWQPITKPTGMIKHDFNGKTTWRYISNIEGLQSDVRYRIKVSLTAPALPIGKTQEQAFPGYDPKYDIAFMPSSYGNNVAAAIADGNFYIIDPTVNLTDAVIAHWAFNSTSGTTCYDDVGNLTGTIAGTGTWVAGKINNSLNLTTSSTRCTYTANNPASFCFWTYHLPGQDNTLLYGGNNDVINIDGTGKIVVWDGAGRTPNPAVNLGNNTWTQSCFVWGSGGYSIYKNGVNVSWVTMGKRLTFSSFGRSSNGIIGMIDETTFYNRSINDDEVAAIYGNESAGTAYPYPSSAPPFVNSSSYWLQNITNQTVNHNGTPQILSIKFNATNASTACLITNLSTNSTLFPMDNATGWLNISGPNISRTGVYYLQAIVVDNCSNTMTQPFWINITNKAPVNDWYLHNRTFNHNASYATGGDDCYDEDNDVLIRSINTTVVSLLPNGGIDYDPPTINAAGYYRVLYGCSDGLVNTTSVFSINITNTVPGVAVAAVNPVTGLANNVTGYCSASDPDNDLLQYHYSLLQNSTLLYNNVTPITSGNVSVITFAPLQHTNYTLTCYANDTVSAGVSGNATGSNYSAAGSATSILLCQGVSWRFNLPPLKQYVGVTNSSINYSTLSKGTSRCTFNVTSYGEQTTVSLLMSKNFTSNNHVIQVGGVNLTADYQLITTVVPNGTVLLNATGYWINANSTIFPSRINVRIV
jgi:hypothetical protein